MRASALGVFAFASSLFLAAGYPLLNAVPPQTRSQGAIPGYSSSTLTVGSEIPTFRGVDQFGTERDFDNLKGPNGLVMLFFRSADW